MDYQFTTPSTTICKSGKVGLTKKLYTIIMLPMRYLCFDVGDKTIGVARSDSLGMTAHPLFTWRKPADGWDLPQIAQSLIESEWDDQDEEEKITLVVGLPLQMDGQEGRQAKKVRQFIARLQKYLSDRVELVWWDERLSTAAVNRVMLEADVSRQKRKEVADQLAAAYILQGYLANTQTKDSYLGPHPW